MNRSKNSIESQTIFGLQTVLSRLRANQFTPIRWPSELLSGRRGPLFGSDSGRCSAGRKHLLTANRLVMTYNLNGRKGRVQQCGKPTDLS
ncbi:MAG: hypothetical protein IPG67_14800 [Acidobacteria bacterium]|nr:hypothetical protein [Acidobacteriota bacterium]